VAVIEKRKRVMAVGCSHGELADKNIQKQLLAFRDRFKPEVRFELGDLVDTAAFRAGARGTPSENTKIEPDEFAAFRWLQQYEPTHIAWGNHDWRLVKFMASQNAILSYASAKLWHGLQTEAAKLHAKTVPYDIEEGWFDMGGTYWGHGYWYNEASVRDHSEYLGGPCVIAHLHRAEQSEGRTRFGSNSFCVGLTAEPKKMEYARYRRATSRWTHGCVFGEIGQRSSHLWLAKCRPGESLIFPL
jgi:hypothetical protein